MATPDQRKTTDLSVAGEKQNAGLKHTQGGTTTRDDATDLGVPMLPGDGSEPQGPEDALGVGPKRGDYTGRIGPSSYQPHEAVAIPDAAPGERNVQLQAQRPRAEDIGDDKGVKGGTQVATA